jgi:hypothetical protein
MTRPELGPVNTVSEPLWGTIGNLTNEIARRSAITADESSAESENERGDEQCFNAFDTCLCLRKWVIRCYERRVRPPLLVQKFRKSETDRMTQTVDIIARSIDAGILKCDTYDYENTPDFSRRGRIFRGKVG